MAMSPRLLRPTASEFNPKSISGLSLWLDAADGSTLFQNSDGTTPATATGDPVGHWRDKSGSNRHATQETPGLRGLVFTATGRTRIRIPVVATAGFNGASATTSSDATVIQVARFAGSPHFLTISRGDGGAFFDAATSGSGLVPVSNAGTPSHFVQGAPVSSTRGTLYSGLNEINAVLSVTNINCSTWSSGWRYYNFGSSFQFIGEVGEVLVYNRALTTAERQRAERYLAAKWGIALAPQVSNADAQDWVNRVYANGGSVSTGTANAVNSFCDDIDAAGIRDRFYRLNLFAGTDLNAALVPLYRGPSRTGTQYGNATDTNVGPFVSEDYVATVGLKGNGTSKHLNTGYAPANAGFNGGASLHLAGWISARGEALPAGFGRLISRFAFFNNTVATTNYEELLVNGTVETFIGAGDTGSILASTTTTNVTGRLVIGTNNATSAVIYSSGASQATDDTPMTVGLNHAATYFIFARNLTVNNAAAATGSTTNRSDDTLGLYSIGLDMTGTQALAYSNAASACMAALGRPT